ncbi:MAG: hypothetical protein ACI976_002438 [Aureispira sp.]|jgi:hypothetical protein
MNKLQFVVSILLLTCSACISTQNVNKPYNVKTCYKAIVEDHTYIIALFENNTFVFGRDMGRGISLGTYKKIDKELIFSSYIQSLNEVPFLVKESYKKDQEGTLLKLSVVVGLVFLGDWLSHVPTKVELDGLSCSNTLPVVPADFDSIYTVQCTQKVQDKISFSSRSLTKLEYKIKDSKNNYFECYYLDFKPNQFCVLSDVKGEIQKNQIQIPAYLLDDEIKDKSLVFNFEEVKNIQTRAGLMATPEGAMLSAYYNFTKAGRMALIKD